MAERRNVGICTFTTNNGTQFTGEIARFLRLIIHFYISFLFSADKRDDKIFSILRHFVGNEKDIGCICQHPLSLIPISVPTTYIYIVAIFFDHLTFLRIVKYRRP